MSMDRDMDRCIEAERMRTDVDLEELIADSNFLTCLMEMQVHTWEGYEAAMDMFNNMEDYK